MFDSKGRPNVAQNTLYKKNVMLLRGRFKYGLISPLLCFKAVVAGLVSGDAR